MPKSFKWVVGPLVIGVTDKQNNEKSKVDPTESIHKSHFPSKEYAIRKATVPEKN